MQLRRQMHGITLIELMIVVIVLGILISVGYPQYQDYAARAKRNEARAALLMLATNQERFYIGNNTFSSDLTQLGFSTSPATTETGYYRIEITDADAQNFSATATYLRGGNEAEKCATFTIDGRGTKTSAPEADCWTRTR